MCSQRYMQGINTQSGKEATANGKIKYENSIDNK